MHSQVRLYDTLAGAGLPPAQLREALLLRGSAAASDAPPRLRLMSEDFIAWVSGWVGGAAGSSSRCWHGLAVLSSGTSCGSAGLHPAIPEITAAPLAGAALLLLLPPPCPPATAVCLQLNNLETDERYARWPKDLQSLLMPMFPGGWVAGTSLRRPLHTCTPPLQLFVLRGACNGHTAATVDGCSALQLAAAVSTPTSLAALPHHTTAPLNPLPPHAHHPAGRLPSIGRNVLTAIYAFDPASPAALDIGALAHQIDQQTWPVRIGLVPVVPGRAGRGGAGERWAASGGGIGGVSAGVGGTAGMRTRGCIFPVPSSVCAGTKSGEDPPSLSERMGRLLATVHQAAGGAAAAELLGAVRASLKVERDGEPDFGERMWAATQRAVAELWGVWGLEDGYEETEAKSAAEVGGAGWQARPLLSWLAGCLPAVQGKMRSRSCPSPCSAGLLPLLPAHSPRLRACPPPCRCLSRWRCRAAATLRWLASWMEPPS